MTLGEACTIKLNHPEADFWIIARGPDIGKVTKTFEVNHIGIKVTATDVLVPQYLYYMMEYQQTQGIYRGMPVIRPSMIKQIELQPTA